jgi:hypothetical protein
VNFTRLSVEAQTGKDVLGKVWEFSGFLGIDKCGKLAYSWIDAILINAWYYVLYCPIGAVYGS